MKKIAIILTALLLNSCGDNKVVLTKEQYKKLTGDTVKPEYPKYFEVNNIKYEIYLGSNNHEFYKVPTYYYDDNYFHYPDCKKCKKDTL